MKINLDKIDLMKFVLIVLVITFLFCLLISSYFTALNNRVVKLLEYQTEMIGQKYNPEEEPTKTTTYTTTPTTKYPSF